MSGTTAISSIVRKAANLVANIRRLGPTEAARLYGYRVSERFQDWRLGIRTAGLVDSAELGLSEDCQSYEAIHYGCLGTIMDYFAPQPDRDVLLDYGSGMGRALVYAATRPFRKVIGIEWSEKLSQIARDNLARAGKRLRCRDVEVVTGDAAAFPVPPEVTSVFLFNPFTGPVLRSVQDQLRSSLEQRPRPMKLVYMHPASQPSPFDDCAWLTRDQTLPTADWDDVALVAYRT